MTPTIRARAGAGVLFMSIALVSCDRSVLPLSASASSSSSFDMTSVSSIDGITVGMSADDCRHASV